MAGSSRLHGGLSQLPIGLVLIDPLVDDWSALDQLVAERGDSRRRAHSLPGIMEQPEGGPARLRALLSALTVLPIEHVLVSHGPLVMGGGGHPCGLPRVDPFPSAGTLRWTTAARPVPRLAPLGRHAGNAGSSSVARGCGQFRPRRALPVVAGGTPLTVVPIHASSASGHLWAPRAESAARDSAVGLTPSHASRNLVRKAIALSALRDTRSHPLVRRQWANRPRGCSAA